MTQSDGTLLVAVSHLVNGSAGWLTSGNDHVTRTLSAHAD